jgi:uncharacterized protein YggE
MQTYKHVLLVFVILGLVCGADLQNFRTVSVVGTASVDAEPNVVNINFNIEATRKSTSEALISAGELSKSIISDLKAFRRSDDSLLVKDEDINSVGFSINPIYRWVSNYDSSGSGKNILVGYQISSSYKVVIKSNDHELISRLVDMLGKHDPSNADQRAEANDLISVVRVNGIYFTLDPQKTYELESKARRLAVEDALVKGQQLIEASNLRLEEAGLIKRYSDKLGPVLEISSHVSAPRFENTEVRNAMRAHAAAADSLGDSSVPISPGKTSVFYSVDVKFKIVDAENQ